MSSNIRLRFFTLRIIRLFNNIPVSSIASYSPILRKTTCRSFLFNNHWRNMSTTTESFVYVEPTTDNKVSSQEPQQVVEQPITTEPPPKSRHISRYKFALIFSYCGKDYKGLQRNPGTETIEEEVLRAMLKSGAITEEEFNNLALLHFQRAARTDKGVSAAVQVVTLSLPREFGSQSSIDEINQHLPPVIKVHGAIRTTKYFDAKNYCDGRTYSYMMPTFAIAPLEVPVTMDYRAPTDLISRFNDVLKLYRGSHNFHNFTSGREAIEASARRFIMNIEASEPFVRSDIEWTIVRICEQSFMLHQIRKMIGMAIAVMRGFTTTDAFKKCFFVDKIDIPRAPGSGLLLEAVHYDKYNKRFGGDGVHEPISWCRWADVIHKFKDQVIYPIVIAAETEEKSMFKWLDCLPLHTYEKRDEPLVQHQPRTNIAVALANVIEAREGAEAVEKVFKEKEGDSDEEENGNGNDDDDESDEDKDEEDGGELDIDINRSKKVKLDV